MPFIIVILLAAAIYILQGKYFKKYWMRELSASISYNKSYAEVGEPVELIEQVENRKALPIPVLYLKYKTANSFQFSEQDNSSVSDFYYRNDIFSVLGNQQIMRKLHFIPLKRGYFPIDSYQFVSNDLFIRQSYALSYTNFTELYVYPKRLSGQPDLQLAKRILGDIETKSIHEDPMAFRGIRDYNRGDEIRHINWKATAKNDKLMVNTYFDTMDKDVTLILNFNTEGRYRMERMQEQIIRVAATLVSSFIKGGFHVGCVSNAAVVQTGAPLSIEQGAGAVHLHALLRGLSSIDTGKQLTELTSLLEGDNSVFKNKRRQGTYLILSNYCREDLLELIDAKEKMGHSLFLVYIDTKEGFHSNSHYVNHNLSHLYPWEVKIDEAQSLVI